MNEDIERFEDEGGSIFPEKVFYSFSVGEDPVEKRYVPKGHIKEDGMIPNDEWKYTEEKVSVEDVEEMNRFLSLSVLEEETPDFIKAALRHPLSNKFHALLREVGETHDKKQRDYGTSNDPFANVRASEDFGIPAWVGCMMRANDKMVRIQTAAQKGKDQLKNESLRDSLMDLAVYSIIGIVLLEEEDE